MESLYHLLGAVVVAVVTGSCYNLVVVVVVVLVDKDLVEHQEFDVTVASDPPFHEVRKPAGGCHQDITTSRQLRNLKTNDQL